MANYRDYLSEVNLCPFFLTPWVVGIQKYDYMMQNDLHKFNSICTFCILILYKAATTA